MNKAQAERIPLTEILEREGFTIVDRTRGGKELWYSPNPLREENHSSFTVNPDKNAWHDFGTGKGGGVVQFVEAYQQLEFKEALGWLRTRFSGSQLPTYQKTRDDSSAVKSDPVAARYFIKRIQPLQNEALINQLAERRISAAVAKAQVQEAYYSDRETGKTFFGLCLTNHSGGLEIKNSYLKTCIGHKDFTTIPGSTDSGQVQVFEGMSDFLTFLEMNGQQRPTDACIILNGLKMAEKAAAFVANLHQQRPRAVVLWLDNERDGSDARIAVATAQQHFARHDYPTGSVSHQYSQYQDLNDYWKAGNPPITPQPQPVERRPGPQEQQQITRRQQPEPRQGRLF